MRLIDADAFVENHNKWYCKNCERRNAEEAQKRLVDKILNKEINSV